MLIDFRAHVVSLVAVFLALGLGIIIGLGMGGQSLVSWERAVVQRLEGDFKQLRTQNVALATANQQLTATVQADNQFAEQAGPLLVAGKLNGSRIVVISSRSDLDLTPLLAMLRSAGAAVPAVLTLTGPITPPQQTALQAALGTQATGSALWAQAVRRIADALALGRDTAFIQTLASDGIVRVQGTLAGQSQGAVLVAGAASGTDPLARIAMVPLAQDLSQDGIPVVGGGASTDATAAVPVFAGSGVSTVDDLNQGTGQIAAVFVLSGASGHFGVGADAQAAVPSLGGP